MVKKKELKKLANDFYCNFLTILYKMARENNYIEVLYKTLSYIFPRDKFMYLRNVSIVFNFSVILNKTTALLTGMLTYNIYLILRLATSP